MSAPADPRECPYVGLDAFDTAHAEYFFGRRQESRTIADHVLARPMTVVYGPSGVGKSSILNVGLAGALRDMTRAERDDFDPDDPDPVLVVRHFSVRRWRDWQEPQRAEAALTGWGQESLGILCVSGDRSECEKLKGILTALGHRPDFVGLGEAAVAATSRGYDVVIIDKTLPDIDGLEAARRIRALPGDAGWTPIIGLSDRSEAGDVAAACAAGMNYCLQKSQINLDKPLSPGSAELKEAAEAVRKALTAVVMIVVVLDQFEEYFLYREPGQISNLDRALGNLTKRRDVPLHVIIGLRDDGLYQLDQLRAFIPAILDSTIELRSLSDAGIEDAIRGPARQYNKSYRQGQPAIVIEDALVSTLIKQLKEGDTAAKAASSSRRSRVELPYLPAALSKMWQAVGGAVTPPERKKPDTYSAKGISPSGGGRVELPYLQLTLIKLWQEEGGSNATVLHESTLTEDTKLGGVSGVVRKHVNDVMTSLRPNEQALCAKVFDRLVTPLGSKIAFPTEALAMPEVVGPDVDSEDVKTVLNKLTPTEARILKPVPTNSGPGFEIFHDVLGLPVLEWKRDFNARRTRNFWIRVVGSGFGVLLLAIAVLVGLLYREPLEATWRDITVTQPYMRAQVLPHVLSIEQEQALKTGEAFKECALDCPEMVVLPQGHFDMGSPPSTADQDGEEDEYPLHRVTIAKPFAVSKFEVTFAEWDECARYGDCNPNIPDAGWGRGNQPVINVTWNDAQKYVAWFARMTGKSYRLLTEAEYEYAARGGKDPQTAYPWGNDLGKNNADCNGCGSVWDNDQTAPVGSFAANGFGLYDMVGNAWEWVEDCYHFDPKTHFGYAINTPQGKVDAPTDGSAWTDDGKCPSSRRVARGGSWYDPATYVRSANRSWWPPSARIQFIGFRVARTLSTP